MPVAAQQPQPTRREPRRYTVVHVPPLLLHQRDRFQLGQRRIMQRLQPLVAAEGPLICALLAFDMHFAHRWWSVQMTSPLHRHGARRRLGQCADWVCCLPVAETTRRMGAGGLAREKINHFVLLMLVPFSSGRFLSTARTAVMHRQHVGYFSWHVCVPRGNTHTRTEARTDTTHRNSGSHGRKQARARAWTIHARTHARQFHCLDLECLKERLSVWPSTLVCESKDVRLWLKWLIWVGGLSTSGWAALRSSETNWIVPVSLLGGGGGGICRLRRTPCPTPAPHTPPPPPREPRPNPPPPQHPAYPHPMPWPEHGLMVSLMDLHTYSLSQSKCGGLGFVC